MQVQCPYPLVVHRFSPDGSKRPTASECVDPACDGLPTTHPDKLPCRWAWQLAHGKVFNGEPFPQRRCPVCAHIRRAGAPEAVIDSQHLGEAG